MAFIRMVFVVIVLPGCLGTTDVQILEDIDGGTQCVGNYPPPNDPCLPECGNELGVGQPCTKAGFECSDFNLFTEAALCTVDFSNTTELSFCTRTCSEDADCGTGAICRPDPEDPDATKGCVPESCVDE